MFKSSRQALCRLAAVCIAAAGCIGAAHAQGPVNDLATGAAPLTLNQIVYGSTVVAESTTDGPAPSCQASFGASVWFRFTPTVSGNYRISACGTRFDSILSVFDAVPLTDLSNNAGYSQIACNDDSCGSVPGRGGTGSGFASVIASVALSGGTTYYIRLSGFDDIDFGTAGGIYQIGIFDLATGACCSATGACTLVDAAACNTTETANYWLGAGSTCTPNACVGACCNNTTGACSVTTPGTATCGTGNTFRGFGTGSCSPNACPQPQINNLCANAVAINPTTPSFVTGDLSVATFDTGSGACASSGVRDVYFSFTPAVTTNYNFSLCASFGDLTGGLDTVLSLHTGCVANASNYATGSATTSCNDDGCSGGFGPSALSNVPLTAGTTYIVRVAMWSSTPGDFFRLDVTSVPLGACCTGAGGCTLTTAAACTANYVGDGSVCSTSACRRACCNPTTGACTIVSNPVDCISPNVAGALGSVCSPNTCLPPPPPANDDCTGAIALTLGSTLSGQAVSLTTTSSTESLCSFATIDTWYSFTPATTGGYLFTTTPDSATDVGLSMAIWSTCPTAFEGNIDTTGACAAQSAAGTANSVFAALDAGTTYYVRTAVFEDDTSTFSISVTPTGFGACCSTTGTCSITPTSNCTTGTYQGDNTTCTPNPCGGACCNAVNGQCTISTAESCSSATLSFQGLGSVCTPTLCPQPPAPDNDACASAINLNSISTFPASPFTANANNNFATADGIPGACNSTSATTLQNSVWYRYTPASDGTLRIQLGTVLFDSLIVVSSGPDCNTLSEVADALCDGDDDPADYTRPLTANTTYFIAVGDWGLGEGGGEFSLTLTFTPIAPPTVVCCRGSTCSIVASAACTTTGFTAGALPLAGTTCNGSGVNNTPCCHADYNKNGTVAGDVPDIFAFLADWFANSPYAFFGGDGTGSGSPGVPAIFSFLGAWFAGCS